jgi:predicted DNA-binding transcriptional regulator AlpA
MVTHRTPPLTEVEAVTASLAAAGVDFILLKDPQVAAATGSTPGAVRLSRTTGELHGVPAPPFVKVGSRSVRYRSTDLNEWLNQFQPQLNTAQTKYLRR